MRAARWVSAGVVVLCVGIAWAGDKPAAKAESKPKAPAAEPPATVRIIGAWESDEFESPIGKVTQRFCFEADGTITVKTQTPAGPQGTVGTYKLEGDKLTATWPSTGGSITLTVGWSNKDLVVTDGSQVSRVYHPGAPPCK